MGTRGRWTNEALNAQLIKGFRNEIGFRDWPALNTQMASAFLDLGGINFPTRCQFLTPYRPYGTDASLNKLLLFFECSLFRVLVVFSYGSLNHWFCLLTIFSSETGWIWFSEFCDKRYDLSLNKLLLMVIVNHQDLDVDTNYYNLFGHTNDYFDQISLIFACPQNLLVISNPYFI